MIASQARHGRCRPGVGRLRDHGQRNHSADPRYLGPAWRKRLPRRSTSRNHPDADHRESTKQRAHHRNRERRGSSQPHTGSSAARTGRPSCGMSPSVWRLPPPPGASCSSTTRQPHLRPAHRRLRGRRHARDCRLRQWRRVPVPAPGRRHSGTRAAAPTARSVPRRPQPSPRRGSVSLPPTSQEAVPGTGDEGRRQANTRRRPDKGFRGLRDEIRPVRRASSGPAFLKPGSAFVPEAIP